MLSIILYFSFLVRSALEWIYCITLVYVRCDTDVRADKGNNALSFRSSVVDEARPVVRVSTLCSLQYFNTDGWVAGRTSSL